MKAGKRRRADRVIAGLAVAMLCALAGRTDAQGSGADREALGALSNTTGGHISSQQSSSAIFVPVLLTASGLNNSYYTSELTLTNLGIPIPRSGNRIGTLRVEVSGSSDVGVSVRTTTLVA